MRVRLFLFCMCGATMICGAHAIQCNPGFMVSGDECVRPPTGTWANGGSGYYDCSFDRYVNRDQTACIMCPAEYPGAPYRATSIDQCFRICMGGTYMASTTATQCVPVGVDEWAPLSKYRYGHDYLTDGTVHKCPAGRYTLGKQGYGADDETDCARILRVGDTAMRIVAKKVTSPGLAVAVDGITYWGRMSETRQPMSADSSQTLNVSYDDKHYYVFDDTVRLRDDYPWEKSDFNWYEVGTYTYNNTSHTWTINFSYGTWTGISNCVNAQCYCRMLSPVVSPWVSRLLSTNDCDGDCTLDCAWGYAYRPEHRLDMIAAFTE